MSDYDEDPNPEARMEAQMEGYSDHIRNSAPKEPTSIADFEGECGDPFCYSPITPGTEVIQLSGMEPATFIHANCPEPPTVQVAYLEDLSPEEYKEFLLHEGYLPPKVETGSTYSTKVIDAIREDLQSGYPYDPPGEM